MALCLHLLIKAANLLHIGKISFQSLTDLKIPTAANSQSARNSADKNTAEPPSESMKTSEQQPWLQTLSADDVCVDLCKDDTALAKQAFRAMVRKRRGFSRSYLRERLAEQCPPTYSFFGLTWPFP
jgi:hypothetical protein